MNRSKLIWLVLVIAVAGTWYYVSRYTDAFSGQSKYIGYYYDVRGLQESSPVYLQGVKVGRIDEIDLNIQKRVRVIFAIDRDLILPEGTRAVITNGDMTGGKSVRLELGTGKPLPADATLVTAFDSSVVESFHAYISPTIKTGKILLHTADSALYSFNQLLKSGWSSETRQTFSGIAGGLNTAVKSSGNANQLVQRNSTVIDKLDSLTHNPAEKNMNTSKAVQDMVRSTGDARKKDIQGQFQEIGSSVRKISSAIRNARNTRLLSDTIIYQSLSGSLDTLQESAADYMKDPPPLINIGFGKKDKN